MHGHYWAVSSFDIRKDFAVRTALPHRLKILKQLNGYGAARDLKGMFFQTALKSQSRQLPGRPRRKTGPKVFRIHSHDHGAVGIPGISVMITHPVYSQPVQFR